MTNTVEERLHRLAERLDDASQASLLDRFDRTDSRSTKRSHLLVAGSVCAVIVALLFVVSIVFVARDGGPREPINVAGTPSTAVPGVSPARPVLDGCTATTASEAVVQGQSFVIGATPTPGEVFADPTRGVSGPLAIVIRQPEVTTAPNDGAAGGGLAANAQINGREGRIDSGGALWDLAPGGAASLYSRGLSEDEIRALAEQVDAGGTSLPQNLMSIGMTDTASVSTSVCADQQGEIARITEIRGSQPSRYAEAIISGVGEVRDLDEGDSTFVIGGLPERSFDVANATFHEATPEEWRQIRDCSSSASACASDDAGMPATTTAAP